MRLIREVLRFTGPELEGPVPWLRAFRSFSKPQATQFWFCFSLDESSTNHILIRLYRLHPLELLMAACRSPEDDHDFLVLLANIGSSLGKEYSTQPTVANPMPPLPMQSHGSRLEVGRTDTTQSSNCHPHSSSALLSAMKAWQNIGVHARSKSLC
jgi:hypothetical protein